MFSHQSQRKVSFQVESSETRYITCPAQTRVWVESPESQNNCPNIKDTHSSCTHDHSEGTNSLLGRLRVSVWCFRPAFDSILWLLHVLVSSLLNVTDFLWFFLFWSLAPLFPDPAPPLSWYPQRLTMCLVCCQHLNPNMMPSESHLLSVPLTTEHPPSYLCIWHVNVPLMHLFLKGFHKGGNRSAFGSQQTQFS